jgi:hypothetical protein
LDLIEGRADNVLFSGDQGVKLCAEVRTLKFQFGKSSIKLALFFRFMATLCEC